jgi:hypothetical protein
MNIPQKADKWIFFVCTFALGRVEYSRSTGLHFAPVEWLVDSVVIAVLLTLVYVIWCAFCRWLARRLRRPSISENVRTVSNAMFFALLMGALFLLVPPTYTTRARILIPTSADSAHVR